MNTVMDTYSGQKVDLSNPDPRTINIQDIAWHLSRIPRFGGATLSENVYCVAQHSVIVLNKVRQIIQSRIATMDPAELNSMLVSALLHDAHEAYMLDIINPMYALLDLTQPLKRLKERVQKAIYRGLQQDLVIKNGKRFAPYIGEEIKQADYWAVNYESYHLLHNKGKSWADHSLLEEQEMYRNFIVWTPAQAAENFLSHYHGITRRD